MSLEETAARFSALYTGAITDVLDRLGYLRQTLPPELRPLRPGLRLAGPAYPIEGHPQPGIDYQASIRRILELLGSFPPHHVAVYQTNDRTSAHLGELSVVALMVQRCAGAVIDGGCRDVDFILREGFPVFRRYTTPQDCVPRWELVAWGHRVVIGEVEVAAGDYVVADADGVVVIPHQEVSRVLSEAEAVVATETEVRGAVREGMAPLEAFDRYGKF